MEKSRKFKILVSTFFVVILLSVSFSYYLFSQQGAENDVEKVVLGEDDMRNIPYITSVAPVQAYTEEEYTYDLKYSDNDNTKEELSVEYIEGPEWLTLEDSQVYGVPPVGSEGQYKFVLRISDGVNSSVQDSYILVMGYHE